MKGRVQLKTPKEDRNPAHEGTTAGPNLGLRISISDTQACLTTRLEDTNFFDRDDECGGARTLAFEQIP